MILGILVATSVLIGYFGSDVIELIGKMHERRTEVRRLTAEARLIEAQNKAPAPQEPAN